jgi:hypothetical protein
MLNAKMVCSSFFRSHKISWQKTNSLTSHRYWLLVGIATTTLLMMAAQNHGNKGSKSYSAAPTMFPYDLLTDHRQRFVSNEMLAHAQMNSFQSLAQQPVGESIPQQTQHSPLTAQGVDMRYYQGGVSSSLHARNNPSAASSMLNSLQSLAGCEKNPQLKQHSPLTAQEINMRYYQGGVPSSLHELQNANTLFAIQTLVSANASFSPSLVSNDPSSASSISSAQPPNIPLMDNSSIDAHSTDRFITQAYLELMGKRSMDECNHELNEARNKKPKISEECTSSRFHRYHDGRWKYHFNELVAFKAEHDHCRVPHHHKPNPALSHWVKRQRYQHKRKREGKFTSISESRIQKLEDIGFVWDAQELLWQTRFDELKVYTLEHGHCNVPHNYDLNTKLPTWIKCQRRQYKLLEQGKTSNMTQERIDMLLQLGFKWGVRTP